MGKGEGGESSGEGSREGDVLRTKTMRFRNPMSEGLSTLSWERVDVRGCEWMAKMCLYWLALRFSSLPSLVASSFVDTGGVDKGVRFVVEVMSVASEMEVEVADREAIAIAVARLFVLRGKGRGVGGRGERGGRRKEEVEGEGEEEGEEEEGREEEERRRRREEEWLFLPLVGGEIQT